MERLTGLEPATTCLEGRDPTIGLQPHMWWAELESNQPSCEAPDLQSGPLPATGYRPICALSEKGELVKENNAYFPPFSRSRRAIAARSIRRLLAVFSQRAFESLATLTGLEPVTSGVTGRRTDQNCATEPYANCCEQQRLSYFT